MVDIADLNSVWHNVSVGSNPARRTRTLTNVEGRKAGALICLENSDEGKLS